MFCCLISPPHEHSPFLGGVLVYFRVFLATDFAVSGVSIIIPTIGVSVIFG